MGGANNISYLMEKNNIGVFGTKLSTAVVSEFISSPNDFQESDFDLFRTGGPFEVSNPDLLKKMPMNSIIAFDVSNSKKKGVPAIFYPFFSSHLCVPVKAGEQVWVIYENYDENTKLGYWICRKTADITVDDVNYCHIDRIDDQQDANAPSGAKYESLSAVPSAGSTTSQEVIGFPEGGFRTSDRTLPTNTSYQKIIERSFDYISSFVGEPVPRFKRSGSDVILQGSNNSLICLGQSFLSTERRTQNACIDLVVGRGNSPETSGVSAQNTRGYSEIDKRTANKSTKFSNEGNRSLSLDSARLTLFQSANPDSVGSSSTSLWSRRGRLSDSFNLSVTEQSSVLLSKADVSTFLSRKSFSILRESTAGFEGLTVDDAGITQLTGNRVYIGRNTGSQPYIRYDQYRSTISSLLQIIDSISTFLSLVGPSSIVAAGVSDPTGTLASNATVYLANITTWSSLPISSSGGLLDRSRSSVVFGE